MLLLTTSMDKDWGFFATNLTFQPFIHGAMTHLIERSAAGLQPRRRRADPLDAEGAEQAATRSSRPDGTKTRLGKPQGGATEQLALTVADTSRAGVYTIAEEGPRRGRASPSSPTCARARRWTRCPTSRSTSCSGSSRNT